ncbi:MAG: DUF2809 domain-containing protein [Planctomycetota bacterium]
MFWIGTVVLVRPSWNAASVAGAVVALTCLLEILQLWHAPLLERARSTFFGQALLGTTFSLWDFAPVRRSRTQVVYSMDSVGLQGCSPFAGFRGRGSHLLARGRDTMTRPGRNHLEDDLHASEPSRCNECCPDRRLTPRDSRHSVKSGREAARRGAAGRGASHRKSCCQRRSHEERGLATGRSRLERFSRDGQRHRGKWGHDGDLDRAELPGLRDVRLSRSSRSRRQGPLRGPRLL